MFVSVCLCLCLSLSLSSSHLSVLGIIGVSKGGRTRDSGIFERGRVGGIPPETIIIDNSNNNYYNNDK